MLIFQATNEAAKINIQVIILVVLLGGGLIGMGGFIVSNQIDQRVVAEKEAQGQRTRADLAVQQVARIEEQLVKERERQLELQTELQAARDVETKSTSVLEDRARLNNLTQAKPKTLERLARKATTKVWSEIEAESRE